LGIAERREREREQIRTRIVEAARDILSEQGLDALSMRGIAERIEYSPATIYLYFRDKNELIRSVVEDGFRRLREVMAEELAVEGPDADARRQHRATGRAYVRFALENTAYFRVMFELPTAAHVECPEVGEGEAPAVGESEWARVVRIVQKAIDQGTFRIADASRGAAIAWGLVHGLTSLYLSGHLGELAPTREAFEALVDEAMDSIFFGWGGEGAGTGPQPGGGVAVET